MSIKNSLSRSIHIDLHRFIYESPSKPTDKLVIVPQHCCALEMAHTAKKIKICLLQREREVKLSEHLLSVSCFRLPAFSLLIHGVHH